MGQYGFHRLQDYKSIKGFQRLPITAVLYNSEVVRKILMLPIYTDLQKSEIWPAESISSSTYFTWIFRSLNWFEIITHFWKVCQMAICSYFSVSGEKTLVRKHELV